MVPVIRPVHILYTNSLYLLLNTVLSSLLGFAFWTIAARVYPAAEVGLNSVVITATSYVALVATAGFNFSLVRFYADSRDKPQVVNTYLTAVAILGMLGAVVFLLGMELWATALTPLVGGALFIGIVLVVVVLNTVSPVMDAALIAARETKYLLGKHTLFGIAKIALLVAFPVALGMSIAWTVALLVSVVIAGAWMLPRAVEGYKLGLSLDTKLLRATAGYLGGNYLATLFATAPVLLIPMLVASRLGVEANAYFYIAWMVANLLYTVPANLSYILFSEGAADGKELRANIRRSYKMCAALLVPGLVVVLLLGKWLLGIFGPEYAEHSVSVLRLLALAVVPLVFTYTATAIYRITKRMQKLIAVWMVIALGTLAGGYVLLPVCGLVGMGYAWLGANLIVLPMLIQEVKL